MPEISLGGGFVTRDQGTVYDYETSRDELFGAGYEETVDAYNPLAHIGRQSRYLKEDFDSLFVGTSERVDQKTALEEARQLSLELDVPASGMSRVELDMLLYLKQRAVARETTFARPRPFGGTAAAFAGGVAGSFTDPINVGSAFIPFVSQARYAQFLGRATGGLGRAAIRGGVGALEGAAGAALVEPIVFLGAQAEQFDYDVTDSFINVMFGAALGSGLHMAGGVAYDAFNAKTFRALRSLDGGLGALQMRDAAASAPESVHIAGLQRAVNALEEDVEVRTMGAVAERYGLTDAEFAARSFDFSQRQLDEARAVVVMARGAEDAPAPQSLFAAIRSMGGIKIRDANGELTREGQEIVAVLGGSKVPGLINNKRGTTPDYVREALTEDGWFKSKDTGQTDIQELYDAIEAQARGEPVARVGEVRGKRLQAEAAREADEAGVKADDTVAQAAMRIAERRAALQRETMSDPDFDPVELIYREPGEEDELAGPMTDEFLERFEPVKDRYFDEDMTTSRAADEAAVASTEEFRLEDLESDTADFTAHLDSMRARGLVSEEMEAAIEAADVEAKLLEAKAKTYEAAAVCEAEAA